VLDDGIRTREHQRTVSVLDSHEVRGLPARATDFDDLAHPFWLTHDAAMYVKPVPDNCLHVPTSLVRVY
jgi:hypothetical protein